MIPPGSSVPVLDIVIDGTLKLTFTICGPAISAQNPEVYESLVPVGHAASQNFHAEVPVSEYIVAL